MKKALIVTCNKIENSYTPLEYTKSLLKNGYSVREFNVSTATVSERAEIKRSAPGLVLLAEPFFLRKDDTFVENVSFLKQLNTSVFVNELEAHTLACNKWVSVNRIKHSDIPFVNTVLTNFEDTPRDDLGGVLYNQVDLSVLDNDIESLGGFPLVYKRIFGATGRYVFLVRDKEHLRELLIEYERYPSFILQEYISSAESIMLCVRVVGDEVFPRIYLGSPLEKVSFKSVIAEGKLHIAGVVTDEIRDVALSSTRLLNLDTARVEMFITNDGLKLCEVNSLGSMLSTDQVHNMSVADTIVNHSIKKIKALTENI